MYENEKIYGKIRNLQVLEGLCNDNKIFRPLINCLFLKVQRKC